MSYQDKDGDSERGLVDHSEELEELDSEDEEEANLRGKDQALPLPPGYVGSFRWRIYSFCEYDQTSDLLQNSLKLRFLALLYQVMCVSLILLNTASFIIQTEPRYYFYVPSWALVIDIITVAIFTLDYFVRLLCAPYPLPFITKMLNIFDLLSFLPAYLEWIVGHFSAVGLLRLLRLMRVFRFFRIIKYSKTLQIAVQALRDSAEGFVLLLLVLTVNIIFFSTVMYFVEGHFCYWDDQAKLWLYVEGNQTSQFQSITETFWWNIVTLTTVGYGDVVPKTIPGKLIAGMAMIFGMILMAFPITVFSTNFHSIYNDWKSQEIHKGHERKIKRLVSRSRLLAITTVVSDISMLRSKIEDLQKQLEELQTELEERVASLEDFTTF
eukprot:TRINITY_DN6377_c0_g2_i1.p1 TRINITY_DN6377_c0_g2~~TRINITY_DN6377_c0_g2_i1.p1  ORF type:complete len:381 (-),score=56.83 TRINITY_DN6377_c0_g2_i1:662-1804(-)